MGLRITTLLNEDFNESNHYFLLQIARFMIDNYHSHISISKTPEKHDIILRICDNLEWYINKFKAHQSDPNLRTMIFHSRVKKSQTMALLTLLELKEIHPFYGMTHLGVSHTQKGADAVIDLIHSRMMESAFYVFMKYFFLIITERHENGSTCSDVSSPLRRSGPLLSSVAYANNFGQFGKLHKSRIDQGDGLSIYNPSKKDFSTSEAYEVYQERVGLFKNTINTLLT